MEEHLGFQRAISLLDGFFSVQGSAAPPESNLQIALRLLKVLGLEEAISKLSVIHVAGTKGKGSTCAFVERILRASGFRTGLFTSPHLLDVRERFRINGEQVSEELFSKYFWSCWERLQADPESRFDSGVPMARLSRFYTVLAFKMFISEEVDVAIMEVGLGGLYDATNIVRSPVICGITSLGYDHMEVLGNTLEEIANQKAGIFKPGVPAVTVEQPPEAMQVLRKRAMELSIPLELAVCLEQYGLGDLDLGLKGDHQRINAALAVALCKGWAERSGHEAHKLNVKQALSQGRLPDSYITGLVETRWEGRAQILHDKSSAGKLTFYLDGAHSPESMEVCAKWFASASKAECKGSKLQILIFNCMPKRDPQLLLPPLSNICAREGSPIQLAVFVPLFSSTVSVSHYPISTPDISWQKVLQQHWETLEFTRDNHAPGVIIKDLQQASLSTPSIASSSSAVMTSLPATIEWLRFISRKHPWLQLQVLVTGSLYLVADVLMLVKR